MPIKARLRQSEVDEGELVGIPDRRIPGRPRRNDYATPGGKTFTLYVLERA